MLFKIYSLCIRTEKNCKPNGNSSQLPLCPLHKYMHIYYIDGSKPNNKMECRLQLTQKNTRFHKCFIVTYEKLLEKRKNEIDLYGLFVVEISPPDGRFLFFFFF